LISLNAVDIARRIFAKTKKAENRSKKLRPIWYLVQLTKSAIAKLPQNHPDKALGGRVLGAIKIGEALPYDEYVQRYPQDAGKGPRPGMICSRIEHAVQFDGELPACAGSQFVGLVGADLTDWALQQLKAKNVDIEKMPSTPPAQ
jgi:hypothetical protein